jgi:hypothetical protein
VVRAPVLPTGGDWAARGRLSPPGAPPVWLRRDSL